VSGKESSLTLTVKAVDKATAPLRALTVRLHQLTAPIAKWNERLKGLGKALEPLKPIGDAAGKVGGAMKNVASEVFNLGARIAGLALGAGALFFGIVRGAMNAGDELGEMADRTGLAVDTFASLRFAAAQADVEQEEFNGAMDRFNKNLGEIKAGGGAFLHFLNKVSPALAKEIKGAKGTEEALSMMTDAFKRIDDPAKSAALSSAAFGKSGLQMGRFLHQGSAAIQEQQRRYLELSGSQEEFAKGAGALDNQMRETETALTGVRNAVAGALFPAVAQLAKGLSDFMVKNRDGLKKWATETGAAISRWVNGGGLDRLAAGFGRVLDVVGQVTTYLGPAGTALAVIGVMALPLIASLGGLAAAVVTLGVALAPFAPLVGTVLTFLAVAAQLAAAGLMIAANWEPLKFIFEDWGNSLRFAVLDAWTAVRPILAALSKVPGLGLTGGGALAAGDFATGQVRAAIDARRSLGGAASAAAAPIASLQSENRLFVEFDNAPKGTRVSSESSRGGAVDLSVGYSMVPQ